MKIEISASGLAIEVQNEVMAQAKRIRAEHPYLGATISTLRDDVARLAAQDGIVTVKATLDLSIDVKEIEAKPVPVAAPAKVVIPPALRSEDAAKGPVFDPTIKKES